MSKERDKAIDALIYIFITSTAFAAAAYFAHDARASSKMSENERAAAKHEHYALARSFELESFNHALIVTSSIEHEQRTLRLARVILHDDSSAHMNARGYVLSSDAAQFSAASWQRWLETHFHVTCSRPASPAPGVQVRRCERREGDRLAIAVALRSKDIVIDDASYVFRYDVQHDISSVQRALMRAHDARTCTTSAEVKASANAGLSLQRRYNVTCN